MKSFGFLKGTIAGLACLGMALPQTTMAAGPVAAPVAAKIQIADVALTNNTLTGKVVNTQGKVLNGSVVKLSLGNKVVASTVSGKNGEFAVRNLSSGVYQVSTGQTQAVVRLWEGQAAPPSAKKNVLLVSGSTVRAQFGGLGGLDAMQIGTLGLAATGAVLGGIAISDNGDTIIVSP
ncbi:MAG: carboxypeptidase regulatory-like domain-containing protein [Planctomycetaceae bacterium]|nr:carboxypeptidase regulatory-like domain-containing protein [Planctomycetaceae bacterium]